MIKPVVLLILDGWGLSPSWGGNALAMNNPRNMDHLWRQFPHAVLQALSVIAKDSPVGDSRLGHMMIGAGRPVETNYSMITKQIKNKSFFKNDVLVGAIEWAEKNKSNLHLMGLVSDGGIHSHISHLIALLNLCHQKNFNRVYIDMITDGTDSGPTDAIVHVEKLESKFRELGIGGFSSVCGRNIAMNRDEDWEKTKKYFEAVTLGKAENYNDIHEAITTNYRNGKNDEFIEPALIKQSNGTTVPIKNGDAIIFFNYREDRARQICQTFIEPNFKKFLWKPQQLKDSYFATFTDYLKSLPAKVAFREIIYPNTLSQVLSQANIKQLKAAESEKYAHVTYFLNGGQEDPFPGEERKIIQSPHVQSFDFAPEMSAKKLAQTVTKIIEQRKYGFISVNLANVDMVAHTGNIVAMGQAIKAVDDAVGQIVEANYKKGGITIITADHGNAEQMIQLNKSMSKDRETTHTLNPVPFILVGSDFKKNLLQSAISHDSNALAKILQAKNTLADIAPTILELMNLPKPAEMTGHSLLRNLE